MGEIGGFRQEGEEAGRRRRDSRGGYSRRVEDRWGG